MSRSLGRLLRHGVILRSSGTAAGGTSSGAVAAGVGSPSQSVASSLVFQNEILWISSSQPHRCFSCSGGWLHGSRVLMSSAKKSDASALSDRSLQHATGLEREELEAELRGEQRFEMEPPRGPFGTKEAPAIIPSHFDERIVGCSGGVGEDEHDVVWFRLKKGESYECPVCTQVFQLKTIGAGGRPGGHH